MGTQRPGAGYRALARIGRHLGPDDRHTATDSSGFFVAANVTPIQGVVSALVLSAAVTVSLWTKPVRVFPGAASLVLFEEPQAPR